MRKALIDFCTGETADPPPPAAESDELLIQTIFRALDLIPTPILIGMDPSCKVIRGNAASLSMFGPGNENLSQSADPQERPNFKVYRDGMLMPADALPMQRAGQTGLPADSQECELHFDDGRLLHIRGRAVPVLDPGGAVCGTIGVFMDITEDRQMEKRAQLLQEEVKHRARNFLAMIQSIATLTLKTKLSEIDFSNFEGRLRAIGKSINISELEVHETSNILDLVENTISESIGEDSSRVICSGPDIAISHRDLASLALALHELTTNSCKYGALSIPDGRVNVSWFMAKNDVVAVDWCERGGPRVTPPTRKGFGSRLLSQVLGTVDGLQSWITYKEQGVECRMYVHSETKR